MWKPKLNPIGELSSCLHSGTITLLVSHAVLMISRSSLQKKISVSVHLEVLWSDVESVLSCCKKNTEPQLEMNFYAVMKEVCTLVNGARNQQISQPYWIAFHHSYSL